ncbi:hypothetical protein AB0M34_05145 [Nocardia sp. NPDC050193]
MRILVADSDLPIPDVVRRHPARGRGAVEVAGAGRSVRAEPGARHRLGTVRDHHYAGSRSDTAAEHSSVG